SAEDIAAAALVDGGAAGVAFVDVSLEGEGIVRRWVIVHAETALDEVPCVVGIVAAGEVGVVVAEAQAVYAVVQIVADAAAVTDGGVILPEVAVGLAEVQALRAAGAARDDVDDAVNGVGAPQRPAGAADDLDALDVFKQDVLHIPEHAAEQGVVDR